MADSKRKVLRSVFLDREVDETLRQAASRRHISKSGLIRTHVEQGIDAERAYGQAKQRSAGDPYGEGECEITLKFDSRPQNLYYVDILLEY